MKRDRGVHDYAGLKRIAESQDFQDMILDLGVPKNFTGYNIKELPKEEADQAVLNTFLDPFDYSDIDEIAKSHNVTKEWIIEILQSHGVI